MKKRETPQQNIAFIAMMAGINIILVTLFRFVPLSAIFLVLILPFISTMVVLLCKPKYVAIYAVVTVLITLLISLENSIFYILTPLLSGIAFGICYLKHLHRSFAIMMSSAITLALFYITMPLFELVFKVSMSDSFKFLFNLSDEVTTIVFPAFIIATSIMQNIISFTIVDSDLMKYVDLNINRVIPFNILAIIITVVSSLAIGLSFVYLPLALALLVISIFLLVYPIKEIVLIRKYWLFIIPCVLFVFAFALLYPLVNEPNGIGFVSLFPLFFGIISLCLWKYPAHLDISQTE